MGRRVGDRFEARQADGRLDVRIGARVDRIVLEMQQAETVAGLAVVGAPVVKGEELEIGHADRLLDPQGRRDLHRVAERHRARLSPPPPSAPGICHLASRSLATRSIAFGSGVTSVASARI